MALFDVAILNSVYIKIVFRRKKKEGAKETNRDERAGRRRMRGKGIRQEKDCSKTTRMCAPRIDKNKCKFKNPNRIIKLLSVHFLKSLLVFKINVEWSEM